MIECAAVGCWEELLLRNRFGRKTRWCHRLPDACLVGCWFSRCKLIDASAVCGDSGSIELRAIARRSDKVSCRSIGSTDRRPCDQLFEGDDWQLNEM